MVQILQKFQFKSTTHLRNYDIYSNIKSHLSKEHYIHSKSLSFNLKYRKSIFDNLLKCFINIIICLKELKMN